MFLSKNLNSIDEEKENDYNFNYNNMGNSGFNNFQNSKEFNNVDKKKNNIPDLSIDTKENLNLNNSFFLHNPLKINTDIKDDLPNISKSDKKTRKTSSKINPFLESFYRNIYEADELNDPINFFNDDIKKKSKIKSNLKNGNNYIPFGNLPGEIKKNIFRKIRCPKHIPDQDLFEESKNFIFNRIVPKYRILIPSIDDIFINSIILLSIQWITKINIENYYEFSNNNANLNLITNIDVPTIINNYYKTQKVFPNIIGQNNTEDFNSIVDTVNEIYKRTKELNNNFENYFMEKQKKDSNESNLIDFQSNNLVDDNFIENEEKNFIDDGNETNMFEKNEIKEIVFFKDFVTDVTLYSKIKDAIQNKKISAKEINEININYKNIIIDEDININNFFISINEKLFNTFLGIVCHLCSGRTKNFIAFKLFLNYKSFKEHIINQHNSLKNSVFNISYSNDWSIKRIERKTYLIKYINN